MRNILIQDLREEERVIGAKVRKAGKTMEDVDKWIENHADNEDLDLDKT